MIRLLGAAMMLMLCAALAQTEARAAEATKAAAKPDAKGTKPDAKAAAKPDAKAAAKPDAKGAEATKAAPDAGAAEEGKFKPGTEVEVIGPKDGKPFLAIDEPTLVAYHAKPKTKKIVEGRNIFEVGPGEPSQVVDAKGDHLKIKVMVGPMKNRIGWITADEVRLPPTPEEAAKDVVDGLPLDKRRSIYLDLLRVYIGAENAAEARYPLRRMPPDGDRHNDYWNIRRSVSDEYRKKGVAALAKQLSLTEVVILKIEREGNIGRWPQPDTAGVKGKRAKLGS